MTVARALCAAALLAALPALAEARRFALVVGDGKGGLGTRPLRYAERDARRMHAILTRLGGVRPEDARLLTAASADEVRSALADLATRADQAKARGDETVLLVYYSGHAKDGELRLGDTRMPLAELRDSLRNASADVRIGLLDSCQSGAITRSKGVRAAPAFDVQQAQAASTRPHGLVLIASSSADEESQESDEIGASYFTHYLASGLLGDADASGDGRVTLAEAYAYAYARTVGQTAESRAGAQHPMYLYDLGGAGDVVLTELAPARGAMVFPASSEGVYVVLDGSRRAIAEVAKARGDQRRLALAPGDYLVKKREGDSLLVGSFSLADAPVEVADARLSRKPLSDDPQKGASGPRWSMLGTAGGQYFFDSAARNGLFPPAALAGAEIGVRDDLGHDLVWAVDLSLGGGAATLTLPGVTPIPERFFELTGGASLWRDFAIGDSWIWSIGVRVAFLYLSRTFVNHPELPDQNFFTLTPGVTTALSWRFAERWSAVARGRLNYLFYNVDKAQNLGYAELALGVDYALGF
jgi:uncharacterized caspase-like protein